MANHKILIPFILRWEGGFVNDPHDRGGATNKGVTMATWKNYCRRHTKLATVDTLKKISDAEWEDIFKSMYWDRAKGDRIKDQSVANIIVDWLWNSGTLAIRHTQRILGVTADGMIGPNTLAAINAWSGKALFEAIQQDRISCYHYRADTKPSQRKYLRGWLNRANAMIYDEPYFE